MEDDKLLFTDENFELIPAEGEIWPGTTISISVVFRPTEPKHYRQVCFELRFELFECFLLYS